MTIQDTPRIRRVYEMEMLIGADRWDEAARFFTPDVRYVVGRLPPREGIDGIRAHMKEQASAVDWAGHTPRLAADVDTTVITEVDSHFTRRTNGTRIVLPCTDIYRFDGHLIREWQVYSDIRAIGL